MKEIKIEAEGKSLVPNMQLLKRAKIMILDDILHKKN